MEVLLRALRVTSLPFVPEPKRSERSSVEQALLIKESVVSSIKLPGKKCNADIAYTFALQHATYLDINAFSVVKAMPTTIKITENSTKRL